MSPIFADPNQLYAIADRIDRHADEVRAGASRLAATAGELDWKGMAADSFRQDAHGVVHSLHAAAGRLDDAADALRRHAANVSHMLVQLARMVADGVAFGADAGATFADLFTNPGDLAGDASGLLGGLGDLGSDAAGLVSLGDIDISGLIEQVRR